MTSNPAELFSLLSPDGKAAVLALLAHELTVVARDSYEVGGSGLTRPDRVRVINEIQHRLLAFLAALLTRDARRYPDEVLVRAILDHPEDSPLQAQLAAAFERALSLAHVAA